MRKTRFHGRSAFTLIELVVVIVIMAVLSTLAVLSLGGTMDRYQLSRASEAIEMFDARARRDARRTRQPIQVTIDRNRQRLVIDTPGPGNTQYRLPRSVVINKIRLRRSVAVAQDFELEINREGGSPTYAVQLQRGKMSRWLVVLGTSGQVVPLINEGEVDAILSL